MIQFQISFISFHFKISNFISSIEIIQYPEDFNEWQEDQRDDYKKTRRYLAADALVDACVVTGIVPALLRIQQLLQVELNKYAANQQQWQGVESCLHCLRSIARRVPQNETTVVPQVMELLPRISKNPNIRFLF